MFNISFYYGYCINIIKGDVLVLYDRDNKKYIELKDSKLLTFFYNNVIGRCILKIFTKKWFSNLCAIYLNSPLSKIRIKRFIKKNKINMNDYLECEYKSFDEFFIRKIDLSKRPLQEGKNILISPCDAKLSVYTIDEHTNLYIKNSWYTIPELLQDKTLAKKYDNGFCLVFRLCVDDYHRYYYIDDGEVISHKRINGVLHTVRPIALKYTKVFSENTREYSLLKTSSFGNVIQMEVGALLVGRICNHDKKDFSRGCEKGYFRFGGSTIVMLFERDKIELDPDIVDKINSDIEIKVKLFETIGRGISNV